MKEQDVQDVIEMKMANEFFETAERLPKAVLTKIILELLDFLASKTEEMKTVVRSQRALAAHLIQMKQETGEGKMVIHEDLFDRATDLVIGVNTEDAMMELNLVSYKLGDGPVALPGESAPTDMRDFLKIFKEMVDIAEDEDLIDATIN